MPTAPAAHVRPSYPAFAKGDRQRSSAWGGNVGQALGAEEVGELQAPDEEAQPQRSLRTPATPSA